jgi:hypothetical protein
VTAKRVAEVADRLTFYRLEQLLGRGGLVILGVGIWWPIEVAMTLGFGLVAVGFAMNFTGMIPRRAVRRDAALREPSE